MTKLIPNDLNSYPSYNLPVLVKLKNNMLSYYNNMLFYYIVYRDSNDKFIEAFGEQYAWWEPDEIDSWITLDELDKILN